MAEAQEPKTPEEILAMLEALRRRLDAIQDEVMRMALARRREGEAPGAEQPSRAVAEPPPLPPAIAHAAAEPPTPPRPPAEAPAPPEEPIELIPLQVDAPAPAGASGAPGGAAEVRPSPSTGRDKITAWMVEAAKVRAEAPAAPPAKPSAKPSAQRPAATRSLEQTLGTKWLLIAGVVLMLLGGGFFFQYAMAKGWISPPVRCVMGAIGGLVMIGLGEWAVRRRMRYLGAGLFGVGVVWLYYTCWAASPNGPYYPNYQMLSRGPAFALMCVVTAVTVGLAVRIDMLLGGVIALTGAFATPVLLTSGTDQQVALMSYMLVVNAGFLVLALLKRWQTLAPLALAGTILLFAGWYAAYYHSAAVLRTSVFAWAFLALFVAYGVVAPPWGRAHEYMGIGSVAASMAMMGLLLLGLDLSAGAFLGQVLAPGVILLSICLWRRWGALGVASAGATGLLLLTWFQLRYGPGAMVPTNVLSWALLGAFLLYAAAASALHRAHEHVSIAIAAGGGALMACLLLALDLPDGSVLAQLLALDAVVLTLALWRRWNWIRAGVLGWTAVTILLQWLQYPHSREALDVLLQTLRFAGRADAALAVFWSVWIWVVFGLLTADVLVRAFWKSSGTMEHLDSSLSALATAMMFAATWGLLHGAYQQWMGLYTAALGAAAIGVGWLVLRRAGRRGLAQTCFAQGLVLITLAIPIQFENTFVTIAWAIQGVAAMALAKWLKHWMLLVKSPVVLGCALIHYLAIDLPLDPGMWQVLMQPLGVEITGGMVLGVALTAAFLLAAGILRLGPPVLRDGDQYVFSGVLHFRAADEPVIAALMVAIGTLLFGARTAVELPYLAAAWWWLALACLLAAAGLRRESRWLSGLAATALLATAGKFLLHDTLGVRLEQGPDVTGLVAANWKFTAGLAVGLGLLVHVALMRKRGVAIVPADLVGRVYAALGILAVVTVLWAGSFEIDHYFGMHGRRWEDPGLARQMALSLWWGVYAAALLVIGLSRRAPALRYLAIVLLAITLGKVFLVDMRGVEAVYRILSFLGLGTVLLAASWLYHRYFRSPPASARPAGLGPEGPERSSRG